MFRVEGLASARECFPTALLSLLDLWRGSPHCPPEAENLGPFEYFCSFERAVLENEGGSISWFVLVLLYQPGLTELCQAWQTFWQAFSKGNCKTAFCTRIRSED